MLVKRAIERLRIGDKVQDAGGTEQLCTVTNIWHEKGKVDITFDGVTVQTYHFTDVVTVEVLG
jgi:preprotein translocase subunit YajC